MASLLLTDVVDVDEDEQSAGPRVPAPPERFNRRKTRQRTQKRARRSRANEMAKRGMHQRRNKRTAW